MERRSEEGGGEGEVSRKAAGDDGALAFYAAPGRFTTLGRDRFASDDVRRVVDVVQGLLVYDVVAQPFYGVELTPEQADAIHERDSARLLALALEVDDRPLDEARPPGRRVGARCHVFSRLAVAFLRAAGVPARARCGFGAYFRPGWFEDHWVAEYWNEAEGRWQLVDAQLDATWRKMLDFGGDPFDITAAEFPTAGAAWQAWRRGDLDASRCGLSGIDEHGAHWIAGNLRLDFASLNKVEMLPWDVWGAGWKPGQQPTDAQLSYFDGVAELTVDPDRRFDALRRRYDTDEQLRVGDEVFNVLRARIEAV
ncbi:MAG TPA: transglutaminase domain-containing protein [Acidimicrobiales bacterium]|nr:transglutaminase domain-containing protein [Acidimicrobiales bacterium]